MNPDISIIVPIYNVEKYLRECLESIALQNSDKLQIIMINDGSTDKSGEIAKEYSQKYKNFILVNKVNGGLSSARNLGLKMATGKYIMYIDSDDYLNEGAISKINSLIKMNEVDLIYFSGIKLLCKDDGNKVKAEDYGSEFESDVVSGLELYKRLINSKNYFTGVYYQVVKRSILLENNIKFIDGIIHEDHFYTYQIFSVVKKAMSIKDRLYVYRVRENSIMTSKRNYYKRFKGFSTTFLYMIDWNKDILDKCIDNDIKALIINHQNIMAMESIKSYIKIIDKKEIKNLQLVDRFWRCVQNYEHSNVKIKILSRTYQIISLIYIKYILTNNMRRK